MLHMVVSKSMRIRVTLLLTLLVVLVVTVLAANARDQLRERSAAAADQEVAEMEVPGAVPATRLCAAARGRCFVLSMQTEARVVEHVASQLTGRLSTIDCTRSEGPAGLVLCSAEVSLKSGGTVSIVAASYLAEGTVKLDHERTHVDVSVQSPHDTYDYSQ